MAPSICCDNCGDDSLAEIMDCKHGTYLMRCRICQSSKWLMPSQIGGADQLPINYPSTTDTVDHPTHYTHGPVESIDIIEGLGYGEGFCIGNALKYLYRAGKKGDALEDLKKARWYLDREIARREKTTA